MKRRGPRTKWQRIIRETVLEILIGAAIGLAFAAFEEAVYDEKKKNMDVRLDDGEMNVDSLDSTEYSTESVQEEIMYIAA